MQQNEDKEISPWKQLWLLAGILHILEQLILASQTVSAPKISFEKRSRSKTTAVPPKFL